MRINESIKSGKMIGIYAVLRRYIKMVSGKRSYMNLSGLFPASLNLGQIFPDHYFRHASVIFSLVRFISRSNSKKSLVVSTNILVWRKQALMFSPPVLERMIRSFFPFKFRILIYSPYLVEMYYSLPLYASCEELAGSVSCAGVHLHWWALNVSVHLEWWQVGSMEDGRGQGTNFVPGAPSWSG